jgi:hypothetical protein
MGAMKHGAVLSAMSVAAIDQMDFLGILGHIA